MDYRLLGGLEVRSGSEVLDLGSPKQRAVLAVLLLEAGRVVSADRLVELLWGDDAPKAMASLQSYVSHLRRVLEPDRRPRAEPSVLRTQPPGYRLVVDRADVDVLRFEDLVAAGRDRMLAGDPAAARGLLDDALALWAGPPLPELAGEPFAVQAAEHLGAQRVGAVELAAEARLELGDHAGAIALLGPEADTHPLHERLHALLALALYRAGRQADALRTVDRCRRALADGAGLDLGPELRRLESALLAQSEELDWRPRAAAVPVAAPGSAPGFGEAAVPPAPAGPPPARPVESLGTAGTGLIGRERELALLVDALDAACGGRGGVGVVIGDPGIGKTRLVEELVAVAERRGIVTAWSRCTESAMPPFWPAAQLGEQLRAAGVTTAQLVAPPDLDDDDAGPRARFELHRAVLRVIAEVGQPLLLVVDDLQWADPDSLRLLEDAASELARMSVFLVATTRPLGDEVPVALVDCLGQLARSPGAVQVRLDGLDAEDVSAWLRQRTDVEVPTEVAALVHDRTGGNPLFVKELADLLAAEGRLGDVDAVRSARAIPPGVQFVVRRRVARLPADSQQLLSTASVVGRAFDAEILASVAELEPSAVLEALAPALDAGLLLADPAYGFAFSHALVADALADEVNAARRARIHAATARALAERTGTDLGLDAAMIAHHAIEGLLAGSGQLAVDASTRAAELARARLADEDAAGHWANVAAVLARWRPGDAAGRVRALIAQAKALLRADLVLAAKEPVLAAIEVADTAGVVDGMVDAAVLLNHAHPWTNEPYGVVDERVVAALERTLEVMGTDDLARRADVLGALASELVFADRARHRAACEEAERVARASGDPLALVRVLIDIVLPNSPATHDWRRARCEEAAALAQAHDLRFAVQVPAMLAMGHIEYEEGDFEAAVAWLERCRQVLAPYKGSRFRSQLLWFEAAIAIAQGRYAEAERLGRDALDIHRRSRGYDAETISIAQRLVTAADIGGLDELIAEVAPTMAVTAYTRTVAEVAAWCCSLAGHREVAAQLAAGYPVGAPMPDDWTTIATSAGALHVRVDIGDLAGTAELHGLLLPYSGWWSCAGTSAGAAGWVDHALARAEALLGDTDGARRRFEAAAAAAQRAGTLAWLARTLAHQADFLLGTGDADDGDAGRLALARATDLADRHGFVYVRRLVDEIAARRS